MNMTTWRNRITGYDNVAPQTLTANKENFRRHPPEQEKALAGALTELGWLQDVVINRLSGLILDGHLRVELALKHNEPSVPVKYVELSEAEERLALATLDAITGQATIDPQALMALLGRIEMTAIEDDGLAALLSQMGQEAQKQLPREPVDAEPQIDRADELRVKWGTATGQLWQLGEHRLIVGDCTDTGVVARVMGGEQADCTVTDPPYGVGLDYAAFDDTLDNVKELIKGFMPIVLEMGPVALTPGIPAMWDYPRPTWVGAWVHPASTSSGPWGFIGANPILFYGKDPYLSAGKGRRDSSFVVVADRKGEDEHPVSKPLNVWTWLIERMTPDPGSIVFDPFAGSGTTGIACENLGRRARMVEISPAYCAVALQRFEDATAITPHLLEGL